MKLKGITNKEFDDAQWVYIMQTREATGIILAHPLQGEHRDNCNRQAQLEACEKEATDKANETLSLVKGYTEMAVREIFEEIEKEMAWYWETCHDRIEAIRKWQAFKQSTPKKYGGEK